MNKSAQISKQTSWLIAGLIITVLAMSTAKYHQPIDTQQSTKIEQSEDSKTPETLSIESLDFINSTVQIQLAHQFLLLAVLEPKEGDPLGVSFKEWLVEKTSGLLKVLFQRIAPTNAP